MVIRSCGMSAEPLKITSGSSELCQVKSHHHLGVVFNETLTWSDHVDHVLNKASSKLGLPLGQSFLTFGPEFHMYTCMHAFARLVASHQTVKVHDVTAKHCAH